MPSLIDIILFYSLREIAPPIFGSALMFGFKKEDAELPGVQPLALSLDVRLWCKCALHDLDMHHLIPGFQCRRVGVRRETN